MLNLFRKQPNPTEIAAGQPAFKPANVPGASSAIAFRHGKDGHPQPLSGAAQKHAAMKGLKRLKLKLAVLGKEQDLLRIKVAAHAQSLGLQNAEKQAPSVRVFSTSQRAV